MICFIRNRMWLATNVACFLENSGRFTKKNSYFTWFLKDGQVDIQIREWTYAQTWMHGFWQESRKKGPSGDQAIYWSQFEQDMSFWCGLKLVLARYQRTMERSWFCEFRDKICVQDHPEKDSVPRCAEFRSRFQEWEKRVTFEILGNQMGSLKQIQWEVRRIWQWLPWACPSEEGLLLRCSTDIHMPYLILCFLRSQRVWISAMCLPVQPRLWEQRQTKRRAFPGKTMAGQLLVGVPGGKWIRFTQTKQKGLHRKGKPDGIFSGLGW